MFQVKAGKPVEVPVKTKPGVDIETLTAIAPSTLEDSFVYVHCHYHNNGQDMLIRIWNTTYLVDKASGSRSKLLHAENISFAPTWTQIPNRGDYSFLLVFEGLSKGCKIFDLIEDIPQPGGFEVRSIARNEKDVYHINI
jgi:hypothetical protein